MVELTTNRNSPWGAWVWDIHPKANRNTIDWNTFQEPVALKNRIPFGDEALRRFLDGDAGMIMVPVCLEIYYLMIMTRLIR